MLKVAVAIYFVNFVYTSFMEYSGWGFAITPKQIYICNNFNMLGAWCLFFFHLIINPIWFMVKFFYWIFHVKDKKE